MNTPDQVNRNPDPGTAGPAAKRGSRRLAAGLVAGVVAAAGIGLAVQSASAAQIDEAPMGAQLPWDDSNDGGPAGGSGHRHDGPMHDGHMGDRQRGDKGSDQLGDRRGGPREMLSLAADTLGMTLEELVGELKSGKSIADVAQEKGVAVQDVIDALVEQAMKGVTERITELVNSTPPIGRPGSDRPGPGSESQSGQPPQGPA